MFNPIDMFQGSDGAEMQTMARQFGISPEQTARAFEALMPALTLGLQRGAGLDPNGFARMFGMPDPTRSVAPQGLDALGQMFGSAQLMQAVLQQASSASGVGSQVLRQMLPMMAGAVVASIVHVMLNQPAPEPARQAPPAPTPSAFPFGPAWMDMARAFMPAGAATAPVQAEPPHATAPQSDPPKADAARPDMFEQMFRTGAEVQSQNIKAMQDLFKTFWPTPSQSPAEGEPAPPPAAVSEPARTTDAPAAGPIPPRSTPKARRGRASED